MGRIARGGDFADDASAPPLMITLDDARAASELRAAIEIAGDGRSRLSTAAHAPRAPRLYFIDD